MKRTFSKEFKVPEIVMVWKGLINHPSRNTDQGVDAFVEFFSPKGNKANKQNHQTR